MNNCYWSMSRSSEEEDGHRPGDPDVPDDDLQQVFMAADDEEEKDRSLPGMLETSWSVQQGMTNQQLVDEELPDDISLLSSLSDPECCDAEDGKDKSDMPLHHPNSRALDVERAGIPSRPLTTGRKFLSRSHSSLMTPTFRCQQPMPDYSKVQSKVKQYIDSMRARKSDKKRKMSDASSVPAALMSTAASSASVSPIAHDARWEEQEARIRILQEDHDRLFLANARLQNQLDELRSKIRQQQDVRGSALSTPPRRTNSPSPVSSSTDEPDLSSSSTTYLALPASNPLPKDPSAGPEPFNDIRRMQKNELLLGKLREATMMALVIRDQSRVLTAVIQRRGRENDDIQSSSLIH